MFIGILRVSNNVMTGSQDITDHIGLDSWIYCWIFLKKSPALLTDESSFLRCSYYTLMTAGNIFFCDDKRLLDVYYNVSIASATALNEFL